MKNEISFHGSQKFFSFLLDSNKFSIKSPADYAVGFKDCIDQMKPNEHLISFSRLAWPIILTQGDPTNRVIFDDVGVCDLNLVITNSPRTSTIGHVLRNIYNRKQTEILDNVNSIILYTEESKNIEGAQDEELEEFKEIKIASMVSQDIIKGFGEIWRGLTIEPISQYALLESKYSVEIALNLTENYRQYLNVVRGNRIRWNNLISLVSEPFDEWMRNLRAKIKDTELRYKTSLNKEEISITARDVKKLLNAEYDNLQKWNLQEKKVILEKIGGGFLPIDQTVDLLKKKNKFFLNTESFKTFHVDKAVPMVKDHLEFIKDINRKIAEKTAQIEENLENFVGNINKIDEETKIRYEKKENELNSKLVQRDARIEDVREVNKAQIEQLKENEDEIEQKFNEIKDVIIRKMSESENDLQKLLQCGLDNKIVGEGMPVERIFLPVFVALLEDEEEDERLVFSFPCIVGNGLELTKIDGLEALREKTMSLIEDDMKVRSNFEFTMEKINLLNNKKFEKLLSSGFNMLERKGISDKITADKYIGQLKLTKTN